MRSTRQHGFSLLELLVVIVIISILFTYATLAIRGTAPEELIQIEAQRLNRLVQLAMEEAILRGEEYGIEFRPNSYSFLRYRDNEWLPITDDKLLRQRELPENMAFELEIENVDVVVEEAEDNDEDEDGKPKNKLRPQVFLLSSGEITPEFSVRLVIPGVTTSYLVKGYADGKHESSAGDL